METTDGYSHHAASFPGPRCGTGRGLNSGLNTGLRLAGCTTVKRKESTSLTTPTELASGAEYEGRAELGTTRPGDDVRFKGRGFIQIRAFQLR